MEFHVPSYIHIRGCPQLLDTRFVKAMEGKSDKELALEEDYHPPPQSASFHPTPGPTLDSYGSINESTEGYDLKFEPGLEPKYECPICLMCLREPMQTECGHRFCGACIIRSLRDAGSRCPVDQLPLQKMFPDLCVRREIMDLMAHCPHTDCVDIIELRNMEAHQEMCPFGLQSCPNQCSEMVQRRSMGDHIRTTCPKREINCDSCDALISFDHKQVHLDTCPKVTISCDYCKESMLRETMMTHLKNLCPKMVILCRFHAIGCTERLERELMPGHLKSSMEQHMELMASQLEHIQVAPKRTSSSHQEYEAPDLSMFEHHEYSVYPPYATKFQTADPFPTTSTSGFSTCQTPIFTPPFVSPSTKPEEAEVETLRAKMPESAKLKRADFKSSVSVPPSGDNKPVMRRFASADHRVPTVASMDPRGVDHRYSTGDRSVQLRHFPSFEQEQGVSPDGDLARSFQRMEAEHRSLREKMKVQEQWAAMQKQEMISMHLSTQHKIKELSESLSKLETRLCGGEFFWRLEGYSELLREASKGETSVCHSQGFYTSFYGYKLCLRVNFNSPSSGHSQHISLFVHFMKGEFDDILDWPFSGTITLSILDQNEDTSKRKPICETLVAKPELAAFLRPRTNRNHKGFGYMEFAPLEMLTSGAYIKNDSVIVKVKVH